MNKAMSRALEGLVGLLVEGLSVSAVVDSPYREQTLKANAKIYEAIVAVIRGDLSAYKAAASEAEQLATTGLAMCDADDAKDKGKLQ